MIKTQPTSQILTTWQAIVRKHGLSRKQARRLFPRVLEHAIEHFEIVRATVRHELAAAIDSITSAAAIVTEAVVTVAMADFDREASELLGGAS
jgi:hypothetical protein